MNENENELYEIMAENEETGATFEFTMTDKEMKEFLAPEDYAYVKATYKNGRRIKG